MPERRGRRKPRARTGRPRDPREAASRPGRRRPPAGGSGKAYGAAPRDGAGPRRSRLRRVGPDPSSYGAIVFPLDRFDLRDAGAVPGLGVLRGQEDGNHLAKVLERDETGAEGEDVGVVVLAGVPGLRLVVARRGPDARHLV